jgi:hypothetical protein
MPEEAEEVLKEEEDLEHLVQAVKVEEEMVLIWQHQLLQEQQIQAVVVVPALMDYQAEVWLAAKELL